jgi:hypothetical protein
MSRSSSAELLVLLGVRLQGFGEPHAIAATTGLDLSDVERAVTDAAASGFLRYRAGELSGYILTAEGRKEGERLLADELDQTGARSRVEAIYEGFVAVNPRFLQLCADPGGPELDELCEIHREVEPLCVDLSGVFDRFAGYEARLVHALERVQAGESDWFASPRVDSYHSVWFELHENLLATLGLERSTEAAYTG